MALCSFNLIQFDEYSFPQTVSPGQGLCISLSIVTKRFVAEFISGFICHKLVRMEPCVGGNDIVLRSGVLVMKGELGERV